MTNEEAINLIIRNGDVFRYDEQMKQALTLAIIALRCSYKRPQGEWIKKVDKAGFISHICSECGAEIEVEDTKDDKFCFNCGAEMKGGAE